MIISSAVQSHSDFFVTSLFLPQAEQCLVHKSITETEEGMNITINVKVVIKTVQMQHYLYFVCALTVCTRATASYTVILLMQLNNLHHYTNVIIFFFCPGFPTPECLLGNRNTARTLMRIRSNNFSECSFINCISCYKLTVNTATSGSHSSLCQC